MKHSQKVLCIHLQMAHFEVLTEDLHVYFFYNAPSHLLDISFSFYMTFYS